jgi:hypothetical protein
LSVERFDRGIVGILVRIEATDRIVRPAKRLLRTTLGAADG